MRISLSSMIVLLSLALPSAAMAVVAVDNVRPNGGVMTPAEDWNIDTKMDDGNPVTGQIVVTGPGTTTITDCTDAAASTATTANYNLSNTSKACALVFKNQF